MVQTDDQQRVTEANVAFYDALTNRDLAAMERLWFPADWVECVHPGMPPLRGWEAVHESWAVLFATAAALMVAPTDVHVRLVGDVFARFGEPVRIALAVTAAAGWARTFIPGLLPACSGTPSRATSSQR